MFGAVRKEWGFSDTVKVLLIHRNSLRRIHSSFQVESWAPDNGDGRNFIV